MENGRLDWLHQDIGAIRASQEKMQSQLAGLAAMFEGHIESPGHASVLARVDALESSRDKGYWPRQIVTLIVAAVVSSGVALLLVR